MDFVIDYIAVSTASGEVIIYSISDTARVRTRTRAKIEIIKTRSGTLPKGVSGSGTLSSSVSATGTSSGDSATGITTNSTITSVHQAGAINTTTPTHAGINNLGSSSSGVLNNTGQSLPDGTIVLAAPDSRLSSPTYSNSSSLTNKKVDLVYAVKDGSGNYIMYGTYDSTKDLAKYWSCGILLCFFIFSIYLYFVSARLYHEYFDKREKNFSIIFLVIIIAANILGIYIIPTMKGMPSSLLLDEFLQFPNEFILVMGLSSMLLFVFGIFRFSLLTTLPNSEHSEKKSRDTKFSIVGLAFGLLSAAANIAKLWDFFKK